MKRRVLFFVNLLETLFLAFSGVLVGVIVAFPVVLYFNINPIRLGGEPKAIAERFGFEAVLPTSIDPYILISNALLIFFIVLLVNTYAYVKIKRLKPIEAMKT